MISLLTRGVGKERSRGGNVQCVSDWDLGLVPVLGWDVPSLPLLQCFCSLPHCPRTEDVRSKMGALFLSNLPFPITWNALQIPHFSADIFHDCFWLTRLFLSLEENLLKPELWKVIPVHSEVSDGFFGPQSTSMWFIFKTKLLCALSTVFKDEDVIHERISVPRTWLSS